jgi:cellulose synthase operon protein C
MSGRRDHSEGSNGRTEPTLGDLDGLGSSPPPASDPDDRLPRVTLEAPRRSRPPVHRRRLRARHLWLLLVVAMVVGALSLLRMNQDHLRDMVPRTELNDVLTRAEIALRDGHFDGTDGTSARELFQAARALEPDNDRAREGLHQVGMAELSQADAAYQAGRLDEAQRELGVARELLGGGSDVDRLDRLIAQARGKTEPADGLIERAQQALAAGKLAGADGAGALYQRVLAADPDNAVARHGLDQVGAGLAIEARAALARDDPNTAATIVDQLAALLPGYGELPALQAALAQARQRDDGALRTAIAQGQQALREGRIAGDGDTTALAHFKAALALDPSSAEARAGLGQVAQALVVQANAALDANDTAQATTLLDQAEALAPKSADLAAARARLASAGTAPKPAVASAAAGAPAVPSTAAEPPAPAPVLSAAQIEQVAELVHRAREAATRGQIMLPPGDSAYDLYRNALAIDGTNQAALQGLQDLPGLVVQQFNQALSAGKLDQADELLGALGDLAPGDTTAGVLRGRLVEAWLDQAEAQLDRGDRANAAQSLDRARQLAPYQPRVRELALRLQSGR